MKLIKSSKIIGLLSCTVLMFASCSKEPETGVELSSYTGAKMVSFNNYSGFQQATLEVATVFVPVTYEVKLSNTTATADAPITVKIVRNDNAIYEYNTIHGTSLTPVPLAAFKMEQMEIVIPKGARKASFTFDIKPSVLNGSGRAVGLSIASVSGDNATVINDLAQTSLVIEIIALNQWDGAYKSSLGYFYHPTAARNIPAGADKYCYTSGPNTVDTELGDFNGVLQGPTVYYVTLTINANNTVEIGPGPGPAPAASPVVKLTALPAPYTPFTGSTPSIYNNTWDPIAKKFYLRYGYMGANGYRVVEEVLTKQ